MSRTLTKYLYFDVITIFKKSENVSSISKVATCGIYEDWMQLDIPQENLTENSFIIQVFKHLFYPLEDLIKISVCQLGCEDNKTDVLDWIVKNEGKYYFDTKIDETEDTKFWTDFKQKYLSGVVAGQYIF